MIFVIFVWWSVEKMEEYIMVIGVYFDDELLGLVGIIKWLINEGYKVIFIIMVLGRKEEVYYIK